MSVRLLFSFVSCATLLVLGEASTLSDEDQVVQCSETKVKVYDQCLSEANLCQAVKNFSLALICSLCDDNDTVLWYFSPGSQKDHFHNLSQKNKTLFLAAVDVTRERASGCYQCLCQGSELNVMYFSVQAELPVPPTFLVDVVNDSSPTNFDLFPPIRNVPLVETSPGVVCINCSAIGYPNLRYTWTYTDFGGDWKNVSSDPCMKFQDDQSEVLCFTPTIQNVLEQLTYQCEVSNIFQTVTAQQTIIYPGSAESSDWFVRPHQLQSRGEIPLTNGVSTAICAAYQQNEVWVEVEYYVCALPGTSDANESACLFDSLTCCSCRDESCPLGINVTQDTFVDSLGIPTYGCRVDSAVAGSFVCVVEKNVFTHRSNSAKQFIGNFSFVPGMSASPMKGLPDVVLLVISASGGVVFGVILALVLACIVMACCCIKRKRVAVKGQRGRSVGGDREQEDGKGEREPLLVERINIGHQLPNQAMDYHTMVESSLSVRVIAEYGKGKTVSSLWNWGRGGSLRIPKVPEANYMLVVCMPDGNCVEIPLEVTVCVPNEVQATVEQNCAGTGPPSLPVEVTAETDPSVQSTFSPVIPAAAPNPTAYLTEEEDGQDTQTAEIAWSADVTMNKTIGMLQVKPGTPYTLKVPPQQEEVVMKFTTFGNRQWKKPLPSDIDVAVPAKIRHLVKFVELLAHRWDRIGHGLGIENVKELAGTQMDGARKMTRIFETWEERSPKWTELLRVLENDVKLIAAASGIRAFLLEEYPKAIKVEGEYSNLVGNND